MSLSAKCSFWAHLWLINNSFRAHIELVYEHELIFGAFFWVTRQTPFLSQITTVIYRSGCRVGCPRGGMGGVGPRPPCAPWGSMRGPGPALRVPPSHPGECFGGGVRVYLWRTPPAWGSGLGSAYARTLGNKPENVPGAELLRHHTF